MCHIEASLRIFGGEIGSAKVKQYRLSLDFYRGLTRMCGGEIVETESREALIGKMTENLPVLRKKLKLSQESLGKFIGSSRYTVMLIETKKRKMTWNTFLSLVLLFDKNDETAILLRALGIYTEELDNMIKQYRP